MCGVRPLVGEAGPRLQPASWRAGPEAGARELGSAGLGSTGRLSTDGPGCIPHPVSCSGGGVLALGHADCWVGPALGGDAPRLCAPASTWLECPRMAAARVCVPRVSHSCPPPASPGDLPPAKMWETWPISHQGMAFTLEAWSTTDSVCAL